MRVCLHEDCRVDAFEPLVLTRPVFELRCGQASLGSKQAAHFHASEIGMWVRPVLADDVRDRWSNIRVNDWEWLGRGPVVLVNGRWLPPLHGTRLDRSCVGLVDGEIAFAYVARENWSALVDLPTQLDRWFTSLPHIDAGGRLMAHLWDLVQSNGDELAADFSRERPVVSRRPVGKPAIVGPTARLRLDSTAIVEENTIADTTGGSVVIDQEAVIGSFSRLEGPCYVGPRTRLARAHVRPGTSIGPDCTITGQVDHSILHGKTVQGADSRVAWSYVGENVNLSKATTNQTHRPDRQPIQSFIQGTPVETGLTQIGCFIGDHAEIAPGTTLAPGDQVPAADKPQPAESIDLPPPLRKSA